MKKRTLSTLLAAGTIAVTFGIALAAGQVFPDKEVTIDGKRPVPFSHQTHVDLGVTCGECHHDGEHQALTAEAIGTMDAAKLQCSTCHNKDFKKDELQEAKDIFHANCRDCHMKGIDGKKGPMQCTACHVRKKPQKRMIEGC